MSFQNKYKDNTPNITIDNIKNFFNKNGYVIKEDTINQSNYNTWSCSLHLYYNNIFILQSNGKGLTQDYALASGYAELYERFCNHMFWIMNPYVNKIIQTNNYKTKGYYFNKDERKLSTAEAFEEPRLYNYFKAYDIDGNCFQLMEHIYKDFIGVPMQPIRTDDNIKYMDLRLISTAFTSSGMAAGNTIDEALVQAISELFEHHVSGQCYINLFNTYNYLPNTIANEQLQQIIQLIENKNNKFYLLDFSISLHVPVVAAFVINYTTNNVTFNFASAPILNIAIERVITEMYQNIQTLEPSKKNLLIPSRTVDPDTLLFWDNLTSGASGFLEGIIEKLHLIQEPDWAVFLPEQDYTNAELLDRYREILTYNNQHIWYYNNSLDENIVAVQCYSDFSTHEVSEEYVLKNYITSDNKKDIIHILTLTYDLGNDYLHGEYKQQEFVKLAQLLQKNHGLGLQLILTLQGNDWLIPYLNLSCDSYAVIASILNTNNNQLVSEEFVFRQELNQWLYTYIKHYMTLYRYKKCGKYTKEEIKKIMEFLHETYEETDLFAITNQYYLLEHILLKPWKNTLCSQEYNDFCQTLI